MRLSRPYEWCSLSLLCVSLVAAEVVTAAAGGPEMVKGRVILINYGERSFALDDGGRHPRTFTCTDETVGWEDLELDLLVLVVYDPSREFATRVSVPGRRPPVKRRREPAQSQLRGFVDNTGQSRVEAHYFKGDLDKGPVQLKKKDGAVIEVPIEKLSEADQEYLSLLRQVDVTGVGLTADKAEQNAYTCAVERAVGVLVDSETRIENGEIIQEEVLTFSRGYVARFEIVETREEGGLHYVDARAWVSLSELGQKLEASGVSVRPFLGRDEWLRITTELQFEENARDMFRNAMLRCEYAWDRLVKVETAEEPELLDRGRAKATYRVKVRLSSDLRQWRSLHQALSPLLHQIASNRISFLVEGDPFQDRGIMFFRSFGPRELPLEIKSSECSLVLFNSLDRTETKTYWDLFVVPKTIIDALAEQQLREYRFYVALSDAQGNALNSATHTGAGGNIRQDYRDSAWCVSPFWAISPWLPRGALDDFPVLGGEISYRGSLVHEEKLTIDLDKLGDVTKVVASFEEVAEQ